MSIWLRTRRNASKPDISSGDRDGRPGRRPGQRARTTRARTASVTGAATPSARANLSSAIGSPPRRRLSTWPGSHRGEPVGQLGLGEAEPGLDRPLGEFELLGDLFVGLAAPVRQLDRLALL